MKPDDIIREAWEAAERALMESPLTMVPTKEWQGTQVLIARAIMAAKAEEREACAKIVTEFELEADDTAPDDYIDGYEAGVNELSVFSAQAIRNRSNT